MRLFDLLIISICQWIVASNIPFQSSSHRYLQDPDTAQPVLESTPTTVPLSIPTSSPNILSSKSTDTKVPSISFSDVPSARPTMSLTLMPTLFHSESLTLAPSVAFSDSPSTIPTNAAIAPTSNPTNSPSNTYPSPSPTASPARNPKPAPTAAPTKRPTLTPTASHTKIPTFITPTDSCMNEPNWVDSFGDGCVFYEENDACDLLGDCCENDGYTANTACCYCQGLNPSVTPAPLLSPTVLFVPTASPTEQPTPTPTASPTKRPTLTPTASPTTTCEEDINWTDRFGDGCDWYRVYDPECTSLASCCGNLNTGLTARDVCCHCQDIDPAPTPLLFQTGIPTITPTLSFTPTYSPSMKQLLDPTTSIYPTLSFTPTYSPSMKQSLDPTTSIYPTLSFVPTYFPLTKQSLDPTNVINSNNNDKNKSPSNDIEDILADFHIGAVVIGVGVIVIVYVIAMRKLGGLKEDKDNGEGGTSQSFDKVEMDKGYKIRDLDEQTMKFDPTQNVYRNSTPPGFSDNQDNSKLSSPQASATNFSVKFDEFDDSQTNIN